MEKLTLRQFADVTKALVEAGLSKEEGEYTVKLSEMPDRFRDEGIYFSLKGTKKIEKKLKMTMLRLMLPAAFVLRARLSWI